MDFSLTDDQELLRDTAHKLLDRECPPALVRAHIDDPSAYEALWRHLSEYTALGTGPATDLCLFLEQTAQYRYASDDIPSRPEDERRSTHWISSFTRVDANLSPKHSLVATGGFFAIGQHITRERPVDRVVGAVADAIEDAEDIEHSERADEAEEQDRDDDRLHGARDVDEEFAPPGPVG